MWRRCSIGCRTSACCRVRAWGIVGLYAIFSCHLGGFTCFLLSTLSTKGSQPPGYRNLDWSFSLALWSISFSIAFSYPFIWSICFLTLIALIFKQNALRIFAIQRLLRPGHGMWEWYTRRGLAWWLDRTFWGCNRVPFYWWCSNWTRNDYGVWTCWHNQELLHLSAVLLDRHSCKIISILCHSLTSENQF